MSRRKSIVRREPNGKPQRLRKGDLGWQPPLAGPGEVRRMLEAAAVGLRDPCWGTMLGRLYMTGTINDVQFSAGKRWAELAADYSVACQGPKAPRSAKLAPEGGTPPDPDSAPGRREARRHARVTEGYTGGSVLLQRTGKAAAQAVVDVCEQGKFPAGLGEEEALKAGLQALAAWWTVGKAR